MNTRLVLSASAIVMGIAGIAASFLPEEIIAAAGVPGGAFQSLQVQLLGALLFAFAMVNWTSRGSLIGGIYNRPVAIGNLTHFVIGALALGKAAVASPTAILIGTAAVYGLFAILFARIFFSSPVSIRTPLVRRVDEGEQNNESDGTGQSR